MSSFRLWRSATPPPAADPRVPGESGLSPQSAPDVGGLAHLWATQFQHVTTLALGCGGALLVLTQTSLVTVSGRWWASLLLFAVAVIGSMIGQAVVVEEATKGKPPGSTARAMVVVAMMCFGGSAYLLVRLMLAG